MAMPDSQNTSQSSPVKRGGVPAVSRKQMTSDLKASDTGSDPEFVKNHLNVPRNWKRFLKESDDDLGLFQKKLKGQACYDVICSLLNGISDAVHASLKLHDDQKLVFIDHHASPLCHHPDKEVNQCPDFIVVQQSIAALSEHMITKKQNRRHIPWHLVESVGEWKGPEANGLFQCMAYIGALNQGRPDKPGAYALSASITSYQVTWSDASGHPYSDSYTWDGTKALAGYVYSLYHPADKHIMLDPSICLSPFRDNDDHFSPPRWDVTFNNKSYLYCQVIFVGAPWSRMTWVVRSEKKVIIKDSYQGDGRSWEEAELFATLHDGGYVPGWVQVTNSGPVLINKKKILTTGSTSTHRTKQRLVMSTSGDPIYSCSSLLHFLHVVYDVLEAHHWAVVHKRILHRDLSINNILINPHSGVSSPSLPGQDSKRPKFIKEVMDEKARNAKSTALICDLDNGRKLDDSRIFDSNHLYRTGTPMYISCSVSISAVILEIPDFVPFPDVPPAFCPRYGELHPEDPLRKSVDKPETCHGGSLNSTLYWTMKRGQNDPKIYDHRHCHDAESIYWVIVAFFLRALPLSQPEFVDVDANEVNVKMAWQYLQGHKIGQDNEAREAFLKYTPQKWEDVLHARLSSMAQLLFNLSEQVKPEYAFLNPPPHKMHLHEAMQRILLKYIYDIDTQRADILLTQNALRNVEIIHSVNTFTTSLPSSGSVGFSGFAVPHPPPLASRLSYSSYSSNAELSSSKRGFDAVDGANADSSEQVVDPP